MAEKDKDILSNIELDVGSFIIDVLENFEVIDRPINTSHTHLYYKNIKFSKAESHYDYMFNSDGTVTIPNYKGNERNVFIPEIPSAPASSAPFAGAVISVTLGVNFTINGLSVKTFLTCEVTSLTPS